MPTRLSSVRALAVALAMAGALCAADRRGQFDLVAQSPLDHLLSVYRTGDYDIVARTFRRSQDFEPLQLPSGNRFRKWLGPWERGKAALVMEMANQSSRNAPAYTRFLLRDGREYIQRRPNWSPADDEFVRTWHRIAVGLFHRSRYGLFTEQYLDAVERPGPGARAFFDPRFLLARAVAQEQRCSADDPGLLRAGAPIDAVALATGTRGIGPRRSQREIETGEKGRRACLVEALARFEKAVEDRTQPEALVRGAWILFQLGRFPEAFRWIDGVDPGEDQELAYWTMLFRGRIEDALGRHAAAEGSYRAALQICPGAQSAGVGLALALFRTDRTAQAEVVAAEVRSRSDHDPWWTYMSADNRFIERWIGQLRRSLQ